MSTCIRTYFWNISSSTLNMKGRISIEYSVPIYQITLHHTSDDSGLEECLLGTFCCETQALVNLQTLCKTAWEYMAVRYAEHNRWPTYSSILDIMQILQVYSKQRGSVLYLQNVIWTACYTRIFSHCRLYTILEICVFLKQKPRASYVHINRSPGIQSAHLSCCILLCFAGGNDDLWIILLLCEHPVM
jgi:hypothetical protein